MERYVLKTRELALETLLLMVSTTLLCLGLIGLSTGFFIADSPFFATLVPDAALGALLAGVGLIAALQGERRTRWSCAALLSVLALYSLGLHALGGGAGYSWLSGGLRMSVWSAGAFLLVGGCVAVGLYARASRWLWRATALCLWGLAFAIGMRLWRDASVGALSSSAPVSAAVLWGLLGTAWLAATARHTHERLYPGRETFIASLCGVAISCFIWLILSYHQQLSVKQQASYLLDSVQLNAEQSMQTRLNLMHRMAERLDAQGTAWDFAPLERDAANYLRDTPSLGTIALVDADTLTWRWIQARTSDQQAWLRRQLDDDVTRSWLQVPLDRPRLLMADSTQPAMVLLVTPVERAGLYLLASFDLAIMLQNELRLALGPFQVGVGRHQSPLLMLHPTGFPANAPDEHHALVTRYLGLPGGINLVLHAYPGVHYHWYQLSLMPVLVSLGALLLSGFLAFGLGVAGISVARTRELARARQRLEDQQVIQRAIAQEQPLDTILEEVCKMLERELPGALCSVMRVDESRIYLEFAAGKRLPGPYRSAIQRILISAGNGACGSAAHQQARVVCPNIAEDERWRGFRGVAKEAGLAACWSSPVFGGDGQLVGTIAIYYPRPTAPESSDLDTIDKAAGLVALAIERFEVRRSLENSEQRYRSLFTHHPDAVFTLDGAGHFVTLNATCAELLGHDAEALLGKPLTQFIGPDDSPRIEAYIATTLEGQINRYELTLEKRDERKRILAVVHIPMVVNGVVEGVHGIAQEVTAAREQQALLAYHASHDALTRLPNRTLFEETLVASCVEAQRQGRQVAVLFVDLDDFKPINDNLGHNVGDQVLVEVARRLSAAVEAKDTVARLGGDEFVVLQSAITAPSEVVALVERLLPILARPYRFEGQELRLTASIGIAMSQAETLQPQTLIQQADIAMYKAKQQGRNAYEWFAHAFTDTMSERMVLRNDLQEAIDCEQLSLHYQPLIGRDGALVGVEALLRWEHPVKGAISPSRFIPLAETTGQIIPISEWVLKRACLDMQTLAQKGRGAVRVAVNLSPLQFQRASFLATLRETLATTGLPPEQLRLELTEGILMDDTKGAIDILHALRGMQIGVAIDDFGTGYSSLSYLKHLPITTVKIDRSFIQELPHSADDAAIVQGIISMAHHLGLKVVAEGVETDEQHQRLLAYGCDAFQGFGLARPMPLGELDLFIARLASQALP